MIDLIRRHPGEQVALVEAESRQRVSYRELMDRADAAAEQLSSAMNGPGLVFLSMGSDVESVALYLACLATRIPVGLIEAQAEPLARMIAAYEPQLLLLPAASPAPAGYVERPLAASQHRAWIRDKTIHPPLHPDLALLLTTSGSTGSPKLVRLTLRNLLSNAQSIAQYLELEAEARAIASLPLHYSYGLSVLHSHLVAGGSVVLTPHSFITREFWKTTDEEECTSFAGVPYMYETLHRLRFDPARHTALRTYTQAGGGLRPDLIAHFHERTSGAGARFFVMYGQTEATARMSYVPAAELHRKIGSIGIPIPNGKMTLAPVANSEDGMELVYEGPNVMMGYAESGADLALGDVLGGVLRTGDLGRMDEDGYFFVTGRLQRFAKLFGLRISLEDVERELESRFPVRVAATDGGDRIVLHTEKTGVIEADEIGTHVSKMLGVPPAAVAVVVVRALPRTSSGKKDYRALEVPA